MTNHNIPFKLVVVLLLQVCAVLLFVGTISIHATTSSVSDNNNDNDNNGYAKDDETKYIYKDQFKDIRRQLDEDIKSSLHTNGMSYGIKGFSSGSHRRRTKESINPKLDQTLSTLVDIHNINGPLTRIDSLFDYDILRMVGNDTVLVDLVGNDAMLHDNVDGINLKTELLKDGYNVINCEKKMCSLYVLINQLVRLANLKYVHQVRPALAITNIGSVTSEGDFAMLTNQVRSTYNVNGSGLLIGVMSDSYNCLNGASRDIGTNDLPSSSNIIVVKDLNSTECASSGSDEGRAMMQLVYDVVPGARLAFRTAFRGAADFATGIRELANIGCDIIVDDISSLIAPFFQDGVIAQAVDEVVTNGVLYFSSIGNYRDNSWDAPFGFVRSNVSDTDGEYHRFGIASNGDPILYQIISIPNVNANLRFTFQWSEPYYSVSGGSGSRSDLDIYFAYNNRFFAEGARNNTGSDPYEFVFFNPSSLGSFASTINIRMYIQLFSGPPPKQMKLMVFTGSKVTFEYGRPGTSMSFGHSNSALGAGVGAAAYDDTPAYGVSPPIIETFSSFGGTPIIYDKSGNLLPSVEIRKQPRFVGPDGGITTFFGDSNNRFFGTSAAAPHVAAVAALLLQGAGGRRSLTPAAVYKILQDTAVDMNDVSTPSFDVGFDFNTGYGLVNALAAFQVVRSGPTPTAPVKTPIVAPVSVPTPIAIVPIKTPISVPNVPTNAAPATVPLSGPNVPMFVPPTNPAPVVPNVPVPVPTTIIKPGDDCGLFGLNIFCPFTFCGLFGRLLGLCKK